MTRRPSRSSNPIENEASIPLSPANRHDFTVLAVAIVWLIGFSSWFFSLDLFNNPGMTRWSLFSAIPFDLLDVVDPPNDSKSAPWSWLFLLQRIPFLGTAVVIWLLAYGMGSLVLRLLRIKVSSDEHFFFSMCLGFSIVSLITLFMGLCACLNRWVLLAVLLVGPVVEALHTFRTSRREVRTRDQVKWSRPSISWIGWVILGFLAPFIFTQLLGAMSPQVDFDVVEYHLGGPKEWFLQGRIARLPHNIYTNFPFLSEMLVLAGMVIYGDWQWGALAGQATIAGFIPLTALGLFAAGRRWFSSTAGAIGAIVYLTSPWSYRIAIIAYAEGSLTCYLFASCYAALRFWESVAGESDADHRSRESTDVGTSAGYQSDALGDQKVPLSGLTGLMCGSAMACKYTGLLSVVIPIGLFFAMTAVRDSEMRRVRLFAMVVGFFCLGVIATVGPWLLKNAIFTGNPVYPLAYRIFGGVDRDEELDQKWRRAHGTHHYASSSDRVKDLGVKLADVTAHNDWHSPLMFGLAPLSLLFLLRRPVPGSKERKQKSIVGVVWLFILWQFLTWWGLTHQLDRFYVPMFSAVALLAGAGACRPAPVLDGNRVCLPSRLWMWCSGVIIFTSILYNTFIMLHLGGFNAGRMDLTAARDLIATPERIGWLNREFESGRLPANTKVLCVGEAQMFHARYPYLYNTVFDRCIFEELCSDRSSTEGGLRPVEEIRSEFQRLGITHVDVNWQEIERYRAPGSYGYTDFVQPERFAELQRLGLLGSSLLTTKDSRGSRITGQIFPVLN